MPGTTGSGFTAPIRPRGSQLRHQIGFLRRLGHGGCLTLSVARREAVRLSGVPSDYVNGTIETVTGRKGSLTRALRIHSKKPNPNACCQQAVFGNTELKSRLGHLYVRAYARFNPELATQAASMGSSYWRTFLGVQDSCRSAN